MVPRSVEVEKTVYTHCGSAKVPDVSDEATVSTRCSFDVDEVCIGSTGSSETDEV